MPLYDYECDACEIRFERLVRNATDKVECEQCGGKTRKMIGLPGKPVFKGSGFYGTDYSQAQEKADDLFEKNPEMPGWDQG